MNVNHAKDVQAFATDTITFVVYLGIGGQSHSLDRRKLCGWLKKLRKYKKLSYEKMHQFIDKCDGKRFGKWKINVDESTVRVS